MNVSLHASRIDLPESTRRQMIDLLNARLADAVNLATQMKQAHWNVKGPSFIALHELFDAVHADTLVQVDDLAERITTLGGTAMGTVAVAAAESDLPEYPLDIFSGGDHVEAVSVALSSFGAAMRSAISSAGNAGDADTEDLCVEISRGVDKNLWLVEAHAQA
jgi:starvation-inducible DNA-binding protein